MEKEVNMDPGGWFSRAHLTRRLTRENVTQAGGAAINVVAGRMQVAVPYHPLWASWARRNKGRWRIRTQFWSFPLSNRLSVLNGIVGMYGLHALSKQWQESRRALHKELYGDTEPGS